MPLETLPSLDQNSLRVLGCLMEKEMTTPDLYPLSVNALEQAANQRSSREPVMDLDEEAVRSALDVLEAHELIAPVRGSRVPRFEHRIRTVLNLRRDETAALCLLLLRGAQTAGELRSRTERLFAFDDLGAVQATLDRMAARELPLVRQLPRVPGSREVRWMHLLGDSAMHPAVASSVAVAAAAKEDGAALETLAAAVAALTARVTLLEEQLNLPREHSAP